MGLHHAARMPGLPQIRHFPAGGRLHPGSNGHNRGFPGTVFTHQPPDFPAAYGNVHILQRNGGAERLVHMPHFQQNFPAHNLLLLFVSCFPKIYPIFLFHAMHLLLYDVHFFSQFQIVILFTMSGDRKILQSGPCQDVIFAVCWTKAVSFQPAAHFQKRCFRRDRKCLHMKSFIIIKICL